MSAINVTDGLRQEAKTLLQSLSAHCEAVKAQIETCDFTELALANSTINHFSERFNAVIARLATVPGVTVGEDIDGGVRPHRDDLPITEETLPPLPASNPDSDLPIPRQSRPHSTWSSGRIVQEMLMPLPWTEYLETVSTLNPGNDQWLHDNPIVDGVPSNLDASLPTDRSVSLSAHERQDHPPPPDISPLSIVADVGSDTPFSLYQVLTQVVKPFPSFIPEFKASGSRDARAAEYLLTEERQMETFTIVPSLGDIAIEIALSMDKHPDSEAQDDGRVNVHQKVLTMSQIHALFAGATVFQRVLSLAREGDIEFGYRCMVAHPISGCIEITQGHETGIYARSGSGCARGTEYEDCSLPSIRAIPDCEYFTVGSVELKTWLSLPENYYVKLLSVSRHLFKRLFDVLSKRDGTYKGISFHWHWPQAGNRIGVHNQLPIQAFTQMAQRGYQFAEGSCLKLSIYFYRPSPQSRRMYASRMYHTSTTATKETDNSAMLTNFAFWLIAHDKQLRLKFEKRIQQLNVVGVMEEKPPLEHTWRRSHIWSPNSDEQWEKFIAGLEASRHEPVPVEQQPVYHQTRGQTTRMPEI
ncbi:hypothetical protein EV421DRAFT_1741447 [Armillaria borealis]|uniref:Uncharacterized protein n=1 Tax=Armillaria borealis TaxID=47425 RepID=A0AA39J037_9AGAR|nr:hypothetical protein EV421DRAFT_1741447 [Armillaria borealis]